MEFLKRELKLMHAFSPLQETLKKPGLCVAEGVSEGALSALCCALTEEERAPSLVVCADEKEAFRVSLSLRAFGTEVFFFPARELSLIPDQARSEEFSTLRLSVLCALHKQEKVTVVTTPEALLQSTIPPKEFDALFFSLTVGKALSPEDLCRRLVQLGFSHAERVEGVGQFSRRGGIVDFFSPSHADACRVEFFGDEIDRITSFDTATQKSVLNETEVTLLPARELYLSADARGLLAERIDAALDQKRLSDAAREYLCLQKEALENRREAADTLFPLLYPYACLADHFPSDSLFFCTSFSRCAKALSAASRAENALFEAAAQNGAFALSSPHALGDENDLLSLFRARRTLLLSTLSEGGLTQNVFSFHTRPSPLFFENREVLSAALHDLVEASCRICYLASSAFAVDNLVAILIEEGFDAYGGDPENNPPKAGQICVFFSDEVLHRKGRVIGFESPETHFCLLCESAGEEEVSSLLRRRRRARSDKDQTKTAIAAVADLKKGDYVVHEAYGIGVFEGIETITQNGAGRDFIKIRYAGGDALYVPCSNLSQVSKYIGRGTDGTLTLSRMGHSRWNEHKSRAKRAAKDIARELVALYAAREKSEGFAFSPDTPWQAQFEEAFDYEETEGQLRAASEVKRDMESRRPMDRLLCGDVGFGKTEVALRAVFKCVMDSRQAAILAPTTLLAAQHYRTVLSRFRGYPVRVALLNRFCTKKEVTKTLSELASGACDVVIGTHRILQKDVKFARLGLLVVDEEQRFGVSHKEKLKQLAKNVDVLTLTATPIPRTLNMALSGVRDLSLLEEAPGDRLPVQTVVAPFDEALVLGAVRKELSRRGQVFYLVNDIERLPHRAAWLQEALGDARVRYAHGRMEKDELKDLWQQMSDGEIDVLVCTTIVETGIDLPGANTLIVEHAERFGLSQLHQLRGRVGRSWRRAYAYFTYPPMRALPELAEKRLEAIREFARFGSGFQLAMRDLELRGAGSLLGASQSGHMEKIGYDLYLRILQDSVLEEQGITPEQTPDCYIDLPIRARLSESYVPSSADRIALYQRFSALLTDEADEPLRGELADRFGPLPIEAENLFVVARLRREALSLGFEKVSLTENVLSFFVKEFDDALLALLSAVFSHYFYKSDGEKKRLNLRLSPGRDPIEATEDFFFHYRAFSEDLKKG